MAAAPADDPLIPVILRQGERALGGTLSWSEPQSLAEFPSIGPFAGIARPADVVVKRQVLAEPTPDLAERTWASLADGTPLVTMKQLASGQIVLFHVTAEATWSDLPISGTFVDMRTDAKAPRSKNFSAFNPSLSSAARLSSVSAIRNFIKTKDTVRFRF